MVTCSQLKACIKVIDRLIVEIQAGRHQPLMDWDVQQFTLGGDLVKEYKNMSEASLKSGVSNASIANNIAKRTNTAGGYVWKYKYL